MRRAMVNKAPRFQFYEEVRVQTSDPLKSHVNGALGAVVGRTETEDNTSWYYAVDLHQISEGWCFYENELESTGRIFNREDYYDGTSIRVQVDQQGLGKIVGRDEEQPES
jgi:hypothetical protein